MTFIPDRGEGQKGFFGTLIVSLCIHVLCFVFLSLVPLTAKPRMTFGPIYTVDLVSEPASIRDEQASFLSHGSLSSRTGRELVLRKEEKLTKNFKFDSREHENVLKKTLEDLRRRTYLTPPQSVTPAITGKEWADERFNPYLEIIWKRIKNAWTLPELSTRTIPRETIVHARILKDGTVTQVKIEKSSGDEVYDRTTIRAVHKASPFPPLPEWYEGDYLDVGIRFHDSMARNYK
ncbi:MAG: TonB C-terminal domain-containing protein [Syntrophales bacterium]|nr:TonB C-terminal domain-containing protein [Syntrophales bacterium]